MMGLGGDEDKMENGGGGGGFFESFKVKGGGQGGDGAGTRWGWSEDAVGMRCGDAGRDQVGVWLEAGSRGGVARGGAGVERIGASSGQVGAYLG